MMSALPSTTGIAKRRPTLSVKCRSRHRNGFMRAVSVLLVTCRWRGIARYLFDLGGPVRNVWYRAIIGTAFPSRFGRTCHEILSSFVAPSSVAILSTVLLCGLSVTAVSQTATGSAAQLPSITVQAPKQAARPHRPQRVANTVASRRRSPAAETPWASAASILAGPGSIMSKFAALEKTPTITRWLPNKFQVPQPTLEWMLHVGGDF